MKNIKYPNHHIGVVPLWLSRLIVAAGASFDVAASYEKLSAITSPSDVCFYHLYQLRKNTYVGKTFDDMCSIALNADNLAWLEQNQSALQAAQIEFDAMWNKHSDDIMGDSVPAYMRKNDYVPRAVQEHTLLLVANNESPLTDARSFFKACIVELDKQMRFDRYKKLFVFGRYCVA